MATTTTVVTAQPGAPVENTMANMQAQGYQRPWSSDLCGCCENMHSCCCVLFFGPCFTCHMARKMGESCCIPMCVPNAVTAMRTKMRTMHNIQGSICDDCLMQTFCGPLVICQLHREMVATGMWK